MRAVAALPRRVPARLHRAGLDFHRGRVLDDRMDSIRSWAAATATTRNSATQTAVRDPPLACVTGGAVDLGIRRATYEARPERTLSRARLSFGPRSGSGEMGNVAIALRRGTLLSQRINHDRAPQADGNCPDAEHGQQKEFEYCHRKSNMRGTPQGLPTST